MKHSPDLEPSLNLSESNTERSLSSHFHLPSKVHVSPIPFQMEKEVDGKLEEQGKKVKKEEVEVHVEVHVEVEEVVVVEKGEENVEKDQEEEQKPMELVKHLKTQPFSKNSERDQESITKTKNDDLVKELNLETKNNFTEEQMVSSESSPSRLEEDFPSMRSPSSSARISETHEKESDIDALPEFIDDPIFETSLPLTSTFHSSVSRLTSPSSTHPDSFLEEEEEELNLNPTSVKLEIHLFDEEHKVINIMDHDVAHEPNDDLHETDTELLQLQEIEKKFDLGGFVYDELNEEEEVPQTYLFHADKKDGRNQPSPVIHQLIHEKDGNPSPVFAEQPGFFSSLETHEIHLLKYVEKESDTLDDAQLLEGHQPPSSSIDVTPNLTSNPHPTSTSPSPSSFTSNSTSLAPSFSTFLKDDKSTLDFISTSNPLSSSLSSSLLPVPQSQPFMNSPTFSTSPTTTTATTTTRSSSSSSITTTTMTASSSPSATASISPSTFSFIPDSSLYPHEPSMAYQSFKSTSELSPPPVETPMEDVRPAVLLHYLDHTYSLFDPTQPNALFTSSEDFESYFYADMNEFIRQLKEYFEIENDVMIRLDNLDNLILHEETDLSRENYLDNFWALRSALFPTSLEPLSITVLVLPYSTQLKLATLVTRARDMKETSLMPFESSSSLSSSSWPSSSLSSSSSSSSSSCSLGMNMNAPSSSFPPNLTQRPPSTYFSPSLDDPAKETTSSPFHSPLIASSPAGLAVVETLPTPTTATATCDRSSNTQEEGTGSLLTSTSMTALLGPCVTSSFSSVPPNTSSPSSLSPKPSLHVSFSLSKKRHLEEEKGEEEDEEEEEEEEEEMFVEPREGNGTKKLRQEHVT
ncbi:hypothetical protein HMI55_000709 [Coelomomyces lativittatus]|nr:hypothetical protein HMI55_000709 [Coelomomyces lativittatus]